MPQPPEPSRKSGSFLVRIWQEPASNEASAEGVRTYVRNLQTGAEQHLSDTAELAIVLMGELEGEQGESASDEKPL